MAEQLNYEINVGGNAKLSVGFIKTELRKANDELIEAQVNFGNYSKEAINAANKVAYLKDKIKEAKETADLFDPGKKFQTLTNTLSTVAGGFSAVQGAIGLFGAESKELEKQLLKVQSALALSQGLSVIADGAKDFERLSGEVKRSTIFIKGNEVATKGAALATKLFGGAVDTTATSFKVLKGAIAATGIGLLVVALGYVIEKITSLGNASEEAAKKQKELNEQLANTSKAALNAAEKFIDSETKIKIARAKIRGASEKELFEIEQQGIKAKINKRNEYYETLLKTDRKAASDLANQNAAAQDELLLNELNFIAEQNKQKEQKRQEDYKKKKELEKKEEEDRIELLKKIDENGREARRRYGLEQIKLTEARIEAREKQKEEDDKELERLFEQEEKAQSVVIDTRNKTLIKQKELNDAELNATIALQDAKFAAASAGLNLLGSLVGQNEKLANTLFVLDKALAIGKIVVDTQREIAGYAAANSVFGPAGLALTAKMALGAKIRAAAGIATIAATTIAKFKGGSSASNFGSGGAINTQGSPIIPTQQQPQVTQLNQATINALGNQAVRAYVVETDVTSSQQRITAIQQRARFD